MSTNRDYQICSKTIMDTSDKDIEFDQNGVSNYYHEFQKFKKELPKLADREALLQSKINKIKANAINNDYDCVLGLSGGVDSTYLAYLAKEWGLRPLLVHFDNGWNSELAVNNIENTINSLGFELNTFVMDWEEFKDLQRSYFLSSVIDIEVPTDNLIFGALFRIAKKYNVRTILSGTNYATEWLMPPSWNYRKNDAVNLRSIQKKFGSKRLKKLPILGVWNQAAYNIFYDIKTFAPLDLIDYSKDSAKNVLINKLGWRDYGGKHYESIFTRFYQGYVLPNKFGVDKRRAHLSNLILTGEISRDDAMKEIQQPPYNIQIQNQDFEYVSKKLGFTKIEFNKILTQKPVNHNVYGTDKHYRKIYFESVNIIKKILGKS